MVSIGDSHLNADFHDINSPSMANFKLLPLWSQLACQVFENLAISSQLLLRRLQDNAGSACPTFYELPPEDMVLAITYLHNSNVLLFYLFLIVQIYFLQSHWYVKCKQITPWQYGLGSAIWKKKEIFLWLYPFKYFSSNSFWHVAWWKGTAHKQRLGNMVIFWFISICEIFYLCQAWTHKMFYDYSSQEVVFLEFLSWLSTNQSN